MIKYHFKLSENASIGLDLMRGLSAQLVVIGHGISFMGIALFLQPPNFPWIQNIGVLVFFLLSGLLITHSTFSKMSSETYTFKTYFIDRFSRIYSGYIPVLLVIVVLDGIYLYHLNGDGFFLNAYNPGTFVGNLLMLQDYPLFYFQPFKPFISCTSFGTAAPFWMLPIMWWTYMFFGWIVLGRKVVKNKGLYYIILLFFSIVPFFNSVLGSLGSGLTVVWMVGLLVALLLNTEIHQNLKNKSLALSILFSALAFGKVYVTKNAYELIFALFLAAAMYFFIVYANQSQFKVPRTTKKTIRILSKYSFTLYMLHYTIFTIFTTFKNSYSPYLLFIVAFVLSNVFSLIIAYFTEMRYKDFRKYLSGAQTG